MNIQKVKISEIRENPNNPRVIKDEKFKKLVKSIQDFPEMLELRPIIVDDDMVVLGGNMRLKALKELKYTEVPIIQASQLTEEQKKEFIIKDNIGYGEWDWDILANEWDNELLDEWGMDVPKWDAFDANTGQMSGDTSVYHNSVEELDGIEDLEELLNDTQAPNTQDQIIRGILMPVPDVIYQETFAEFKTALNHEKENFGNILLQFLKDNNKKYDN